MTAFTVPGLDGITFTATYDTEESWLRIEGHDTDGQQVSGSGFSITPDPIEPITITPEPVIPGEDDPLSAAQQHLDPPEEP
ncbi:hypothetical protein A5N78_04445 [Prescottella equi]|uniref:hypothetical protein n=1 Tax=Rhodococcus hoagii TaxID=43767 RepID=UPI000A10EEA2|nr:hypothetical protein [Prescottella equi]ORL93390.1 hypothetical protein A5N78_04445 [Prescottella equi]ORM17743.1 hypothetical protein A5N70_11020 [Prescottella equi]